MLKNISPIISPELLKILDEMGHGDEIVIGELKMLVRSYAYWESENTLVMHIRPLLSVAERVLKFEFNDDKIKMYPSYIPMCSTGKVLLKWRNTRDERDVLVNVVKWIL